MTAIGLPPIGAGWIDGDAAAYAAQVAAGDLSDRWTHMGYVAVGVAVQRVTGLEPTLALDLLSLVASAGLVIVAGLRAGPVAAWGTAAAALPWASFAEVDPVWICFALGALRAPSLIALAIAVSPVALLAVPWVALERREHARAVIVWALVAVIALTVASGGAWWTGERGVLHARLLPGRTLLAWALHATPLLVLLPGARIHALPLLGLAPLAFAPPDVPAWTLGSIAVAIVVARAGRRAAPALAVALVVALLEHGGRVRQVRAEQRTVEAIARLLGPDDGLVAPFTWGARIAVYGTGDPYGLRWHPPDAFLRDQAQEWCAAPPRRALIMGEGLPRWTEETACRP